MIKIGSISLLLLLTHGYINAQCTYEDIFPVEHGITKFDATNKITSNENIEKDPPGFVSNPWDKPDYLNGDSVLVTYLGYHYSYSPCFNGKENKGKLKFVDDSLYKIRVDLIFSSEDIKKLQDNYNMLVSIFKNIFPSWERYTSTRRRTGEQIGKGYWFYPSSKENRDIVKVDKLSIGYEIKYEKKYNSLEKEWYNTGNIENYNISINYVNLKGTKLTGEGY